jgi:hypothetical protein
MPLSINPIKKNTATDLGTGLTASINQASGLIDTVQSTGLKANLDDTVNRVSGALGSGLNGLSTGFAKGASNLSSAIQTNLNTGNLSSIAGTVGSVANQAAGIANSLIASGLGSGLTSAAGFLSQVGSISGAVNDLLSIARSANIPKGLPSFSEPEDVVKVYPTSDGDWRVRISAPLGFGEIVFPVLPTLSLAHKANYQNIDLVHSNYPFIAYKNSGPDDISISCEWPVESVQDGKEYIQMILLGRTLTKMFYGTGSNVGQPPPICTLKGYSTNGIGKLLPDTPVIIKSFQVDLKDDVSYLQVDGDYVPRLSSISVTVAPIYSRTAQRSFNLESYRKGTGVIRY